MDCGPRPDSVNVENAHPGPACAVGVCCEVSPGQARSRNDMLEPQAGQVGDSPALLQHGHDDVIVLTAGQVGSPSSETKASRICRGCRCVGGEDIAPNDEAGADRRTHRIESLRTLNALPGGILRRLAEVTTGEVDVDLVEPWRRRRLVARNRLAACGAESAMTFFKT